MVDFLSSVHHQVVYLFLAYLFDLQEQNRGGVFYAFLPRIMLPLFRLDFRFSSLTRERFCLPFFPSPPLIFY
eukprot:m.193464 g.193464  ORF g.193464 m.193464 type:complete len:72 (+) comp16782_c3_seq2:2588-2803(+)